MAVTMRVAGWLAVALGCGSLVACGFDGSFTVKPNPDTPSIPTVPAPDGGLTGRVCSPSGISWVGGADVTVRGTDIATRTDDEGRYRFETLRPGPVVVDIRKGSFFTTVEVEVVSEVVTSVEPSCLGGEVSIAVVEGSYDNVETVLAGLGLSYTLIEADQTTEWMRDRENLAAFDFVFFNCGMRTDWRLYPEVVGNLRHFVLEGGALYASDLAYLVVEEPFPDAIEFLGADGSPVEVQRGLEGRYSAEIVDRNLQLLFDEPTASIQFELRNWAVAVDERGGEPLLRTVIDIAPDEPEHKPESVSSLLAVRTRIGKGTVVFTSFHNNAQVTGDMQRILEDIVLSF